MNLTAITEPDAVENAALPGLADGCPAALPTESTLRDGRVLDVGSGAGLPGVALKIAYPGIRLDLLEATGKKVAFLRDLLAHLELPDVMVQHGRAEDLAHDPSLRGAFDAVVVRGVAKMAALAELTLPYLRVGGVLAAHKKDNVGPELVAAGQGGAPAWRRGSGAAAGERSLGWRTAGRWRLSRKLLATPKGYPRQAGMPIKRPIGA